MQQSHAFDQHCRFFGRPNAGVGTRQPDRDEPFPERIQSREPLSDVPEVVAQGGGHRKVGYPGHGEYVVHHVDRVEFLYYKHVHVNHHKRVVRKVRQINRRPKPPPLGSYGDACRRGQGVKFPVERHDTVGQPEINMPTINTYIKRYEILRNYGKTVN